jgi:uncharacterized membrane protein YfcA
VTLALLVCAAALAGALNAVVGGGSFVAFPALLFAGVPPIVANATTTFVLWPAAAGSALAYRAELPSERAVLLWLGAASVVGGALGAWLLLGTSDTTFVRLIPWLLLVATVLFTLGGYARADRPPRASPSMTRGALVAGASVQLVTSIYGGYFGGGMGILMLATFSLMGIGNIHRMNALRTLLGLVLNGVALAMFVARGKIAWGPGLLMAVAATGAGYLGAWAARRGDPRRVRQFVTLIAWALTAWFFLRA